MIIVAVCPTCAEIRARSRDLPAGTSVTASDFEPINGQAPPVDGEPALCTVCHTTLTFRTWRVEPPAAENGHSTPVDHTPVGPGVRTHFQVEPGEEVKSMRELGTDRLLIITTRRIVTINLMTIAEDL